MPIAVLIFLVSALVLAYVIAGYPMVLALWRGAAPPIHKEFIPRSVSVLIVVHNGERSLRRKLESVLALDYPREQMEILVVSDGSTDGTDRIAQSFAPEGVRFLRVPRAGKASALNAGIPLLSGEILVLTDVRQELAPDSLRHLVACFADPTVGTVSAELRILPGEKREEAEMGLYWRYDVWIRTRMSEIGSTFGANGPYYAMRRSLAASIAPDTLLDDVTLPMHALYSGYRLILEPAANAYDFPTALNVEFRRKMRTLGGVWQIYWRDRRLLSAANPMRFHFASQKLARLLIPYALLGMTLPVFWFPDPWRATAVVSATAFYGLGLLDLIVPQRWFLKRLTSPVRSFLVMAAATLCAAAVFFVPPQRLWKVTAVSQPERSREG